ncbi:MAG: sulfurtransferase FdhD [Robiginitomaculum sp.]|nr:MAG: sulfurtransferase FdhD [Robiginitomaculum sp.]
MFPVEISGVSPLPDQTIRVTSLDNSRQGRWHVPEETPVAFVYGGRNYAVMLASPADMVDFALGFSLSEQIIRQPAEIEHLQIKYRQAGIELFFQIAPDRVTRLDVQMRRRNLVGTAGCGICGLDNANQILAPLKPVADAPISISKAALEAAMQDFAASQPLNLRTKSVHGAAWVRNDGQIQQVREDVGRHNALDKLIGAMVFERLDPTNGFVLMSSRCSFEIIDKAARAKIPAILSLSGPTNLALNKARQANIAIYARDKTGGVKQME